MYSSEADGVSTRKGDRCFTYDVFISHALGDRSAPLAEALSRHGLDVWYDNRQSMDDGRCSARIIRALSMSRSLLSLESRAWVRAEAAAARAAGDAAGVERVFAVQSGALDSVVFGPLIALHDDHGDASARQEPCAHPQQRSKMPPSVHPLHRNARRVSPLFGNAAWIDVRRLIGHHLRTSTCPPAIQA